MENGRENLSEPLHTFVVVSPDRSERVFRSVDEAFKNKRPEDRVWITLRGSTSRFGPVLRAGPSLRPDNVDAQPQLR